MQKFNQLPYTRPNMQLVKSEFNLLLEKFKSADSLEIQKEVIDSLNKIQKDFDTASNIVYIRHSIDTTDKFYDAEQTFFDENHPEFTDLQFEYYKALEASPFKDDLRKTFGSQLFDLAETNVKSFNKEIIEDLKEINKLNSEYSKLVASAKIDFEGKELNLSELVPHKQSTDRTTRKKASEAAYNFVEENQKDFDGIYHKLVQLRQGVAEKLGFENYIEVGYLNMQRTDYNAADVAKFRKKIQELVVPLVQKIRARQAKRIEVEELKHYDLGFEYKTGNPTPKGDKDWIVENGAKMYAELSPETDKFYKLMTDFDLMDLETKKGKDSGGYCTSLANYGVPYIFANFNGTSGDIDVLTHEAGHAFQNYSSNHFELPEYHWPTSESAEIHSMSMEFFTWPWMGLFFKEDTEKYKFGHLASGLTFLPYGAAVDEFQHKVYENPNISADERRQLWKEVENKFLPEYDYDGHAYLENGGRWQLQSHIYQMPFYYIDYCLAQICAFQFWIRMQEDFKGAWADYLKLCKAGGSLPFLELVKLAGLKSPFEDGTVESVVDKIEGWLNKIDDSNF